MSDLEDLYRRHASAVFRFAWGLCGDRARAEDLVSETFTRVLVRRPRIVTTTALAYLLAIARNTYLSGLRQSTREVPLPEELEDGGHDPGRRIDDRGRLRRALVALAALPEGERSALLLRLDHDLPYSDIAAALGISLSAAKVRVHRARLRLSEAIDRESP